MIIDSIMDWVLRINLRKGFTKMSKLTKFMMFLNCHILNLSPRSPTQVQYQWWK
jgi:hypothetical protein